MTRSARIAAGTALVAGVMGIPFLMNHYEQTAVTTTTVISVSDTTHEQPSVSEPPVTGTGTTEKEELWTKQDTPATPASANATATKTSDATELRTAVRAKGVTATTAMAAAINATPNYPTWDSCTTLVVPPDHLAIAPRGGMRIILDATLKADTNTANRWAQDAGYGYDWLRCNPAAVRDFLQHHTEGEDPVVYFCRQGFDSPLATYNERFSLNRTAGEISFTVVEVWFNAKKYAGQILPADCLAGCTVYADLPCEAPRQATVVTLREPTEEQYGACYTYSADGRARMRMKRCPPREMK